MPHTALPAPEFTCDCLLHTVLHPWLQAPEFPDGAVIALAQLRTLVRHTQLLASDTPVQLHPDGRLVVHATENHAQPAETPSAERQSDAKRR